VRLVQVVSAFAHLTFLLHVPNVAAVDLDVVPDAPVPVEGIALIAGDAHAVVSEGLAVAGSVHTFGSHQREPVDAGLAGRLCLGAVDGALAFLVVENCSKATFDAGIIVSGIGSQARRPVFEAHPVTVKRESRLAQETLISWSIEGTGLDGAVSHTFANNAQLEALSAGEADVALWVAVVAVGRTGQDQSQDEEEKEDCFRSGSYHLVLLKLYADD
jgi:hypothetical protein